MSSKTIYVNVFVKGGLVTHVNANDKHINVSVIDMDNDGWTEEEEEELEVMIAHRDPLATIKVW